MLLYHIRKLREKRSGFSYFLYLFFLYIKKYNIIGPLYFLYMVLYSYFLSFRLFGFSFLPKVFFSNGVFRVRLDINRGGVSVIRSGSLIFEKWRSGSCTNISVAKGAVLEIGNTFTIGDNCKISLFKGSKLTIRGESSLQSSGITADTIILCFKEIIIGKGTIISWNCYITDSSQHEFNGSIRIESVIIGDHVWVSESVSCGPGTNVGNGAVIGSKSYLSKVYPNNAFIAGCPGQVKSSNINWKR